MRAGDTWRNEEGHIFTSRTGLPLSEATATHALSRLCRKHSLPIITMHSFRPLHASLALQSGAPVALVSRQLGHANVGITTTIYSHAVSDGRMFTEALKKALEG
ncbi:MAG: tyrosine-type recombinase/integrase [Chloroflexota bacterium]